MRSLFRTALVLILACSGFTAACGASSGGDGARAPSTASAQAPVTPEIWLVENFENQGGLSGFLHLEFDKNNIGTVVETQPFKLDPNGSPLSPGGSAHVKGTLGANRAPWSWVQLQIFLDRSSSPKDISKFKSIRFMTKGDGGRYNVGLIKKSVTDYDHFVYTFTAPPVWTEVRVPIDKFSQAGWGKPQKKVFDDVTMVQFAPADYEKPFDFWIDDVTLSTDEAVIEPVAYDTNGWFEYTGTDVTKRKGTALDVSYLLDAPAGKHGIVQRKGEGFAFKNGKPARFIGVNIVGSANFPSHAEAEKVADLLAQMGVNMTRHHHLDADWARPNIFDNKPNTLELGKEAMDRFDYFVAALQKRGIYQFFDLLVHRKALPGDDIPSAEDVVAGYKIEGEFAPRLIELQERFATQFFSHQNPYTKKKYAEDPALAMLEIINEDSLFYLQKQGDFAITTPFYKAELDKQFGAWLSKKYKDRATLEKAWSEGAGLGLQANEDPAKGSVSSVMTFDDKSYEKLTKARAADTMRFYYDTMLAYFRRMEGVARKLGYQGLVTGSNHWVEVPLDLKLNAELGYIDRHSYWSHPNGGWGYNPNVSFDPSAMVKSPSLGIIGVLSRRRVAGLPYTVSEWQTSAPNDYRAEGLLVMSAVSAFQGWHPIQFAFSHDVNHRPEAAGMLSSNFDVIHQPNLLALWPATALLFHRGDVTPSPTESVLEYDDVALYDPATHLDYPRGAALVTRTAIDFGRGQSAAEIEKLVQAGTKGSRVTSPNGELSHDPEVGIFQVDAPRSQGFAGFKAAGEVAFKNLKVSLENEFAVVLATSLGDEPISRAKRVLLTASGNAVNSGMKLDPSRSKFADAGRSPILVEPVRGTVSLENLTGSLAKVKVYALSPNGERLKEIPVEISADAVRFKLEAANKTLSYEVVRE
jgi:hypothetical protein